ncbi:O-antigen ligase family protein [Enterovibrio norvegicus]|uniref:O-antigen ligase-related domain-containing protein n=1 Tax=Enterovibrio norvegicus TaxID=188144 RepID=A0A2N7LEB0_9GAMM|nr:O-antigen ligase family protein [Enterovibrio norvegicus]PMN93741.1 hypothetical protein BCT23_11930 [Enterovibrio norvegicus]
MKTLRSEHFKKIILSEQYDVGMYIICLLYSVTAMPGLDLSNVFKTLILIGSAPVLYLCCKDKDYDKGMVYLFVASILIQIISWLNSLIVIPDIAKSYPDIKTLSSLFLFVFIAFWIGNDRKRRLILFSSLILSFVLSVFYHDYQFNSISYAISGQRVNFGFHNAQYTTMLAAVGIMISVFLLLNNKGRYFRLTSVLLLLSMVFGFFVLFVSQSRQIWIGFFLVLLLAPALIKRVLGYRVIFSFYLMLITVLSIVVSSDLFQERIEYSKERGDQKVVELIIGGEWDDIPMSSFGIRFNSWLEAGDWISDNPLFGASKVAVRQVLKTSDLFQSNKKIRGFGHLHNYYMEVLVAFGVVGISFIFLFYYMIASNVIRNSDNMTSAFFIIFIIFWLFINAFESYNTKFYGLYIHNIILGGLFFMPKPSVRVT